MTTLTARTPMTAMTTAKETTVSAPGKVILIGEYAVLHGHQAIVAAVDRRAVGRFVAGAAPATPLVKRVVEAVRAYLLEAGGVPPDGAPEIDSAALFAGDRKLGLGSSAAVAAAAVGAMLEASGCDVEYTQALAFALAHRAHRAYQGGVGSGADVAAATYGGIVCYARRDDETEAAVYPIDLPDGLEVIVFATATPSSTVEHTRVVLAWLDYDRTARSARLAEIGGCAADFLSACAKNDAGAAIDAAARANALLAAMGRDIDLPIVTPAFAAAADLAASLGGAAKPSGAGGGDVGVAFLTDPAAAETFRARAPHLGLEILSIRTGARGLCREPSGPERPHVEE